MIFFAGRFSNGVYHMLCFSEKQTQFPPAGKNIYIFQAKIILSCLDERKKKMYDTVCNEFVTIRQESMA